MMIKRIMLLMVMTLGISQLSLATNLVEAFHAAVDSDPIYKQAQAQYEEAKTQIEQARAGILPTLDISGGLYRVNTDTNYSGDYPGAGANSNVSLNQGTYTLSISQPLFNWQAFKQIAQAKASVQQAAATLAGAQQDLIIRLAQAYFNVLEAQDILRYSEAQKAALYRQYLVSKQRYEVGLDAITSLYQAQAAYDAARAQYIADENNVSNSLEALRQITGVYYSNLKTLENDFPLVSPSPVNIDKWVKTSLEQNLLLRASRFGVLAAEENIKVQSAGNLPTVNATGALVDTQNASRIAGGGSENVTAGTLGVALNFPVYSGGITTANTDQAEAQYQIAIAQMEQQYRLTVANTRTSFLSVISQISQVKADRQSIKSNVAAVESLQAGYEVGTQTILDVLQAQSNLFAAEQSYAQDRFAYLLNTLELKQAAGTLTPDDLVNINAWLTATNILPEMQQAPVSKPVVKNKNTTKKPVKKPVKKTASNHNAVTN